MSDHEESPDLPSIYRQGWAFAGAMAKFAFSGFATASKQTRLERLNICDVCPHRSGKRCRKCGCNIVAKAHIQASDCPKKFWDHPEVLKVLRDCMKRGIEFTREHLREAILPNTFGRFAYNTKKKPRKVANPKTFKDVPCRARVNGVCLLRECEHFRDEVTVKICAKCPLRQN